MIKINDFLKDFDDDECNNIEIFDRHDFSTHRCSKKIAMSDFGYYTVRSWSIKQIPHFGNVLRIIIQSNF